jgi:hypothetical protein
MVLRIRLTHLAFDTWQIEDGEIQEFFVDGRIGAKPVGHRELIRTEKQIRRWGFFTEMENRWP